MVRRIIFTCDPGFLWNNTIKGIREILLEDGEIKYENDDHKEEINMIIYSYLILSIEY